MKGYLLVVGVALMSLGLFWLPFLMRTERFWGVTFGGHGQPYGEAGLLAQAGMATIVQNFDGLNYLAVAKTLYDPQELARDFASFGNPPIYYAAHFPLYPLLIRGLDTFLPGPYALMLSIAISNILLAVGLTYFFFTLIKDKKLAVTLAVVALFFPARMLSTRSVGSSEPLFLFFVLTSLAMAYKGKHLWGAVLGSLAVLTRSPGIFLFGAYVLAAIASYTTDWKKIVVKITPYLLMPLSLTLLFGYYGLTFGNFWAYFNSSSELHPVFFPPFLIFSNTARWISDMWREDILYMYLLYGAGIALYTKKIGLRCGFEQLSAVGYGVVYGLILLLVSHRDLARYALPIAPVAMLGFAPYLSIKSMKWLALLLMPIYLLGWQFVVGNVQPVSDWTTLL